MKTQQSKISQSLRDDVNLTHTWFKWENRKPEGKGLAFRHTGELTSKARVRCKPGPPPPGSPNSWHGNHTQQGLQFGYLWTVWSCPWPNLSEEITCSHFRATGMMKWWHAWALNAVYTHAQEPSPTHEVVLRSVGGRVRVTSMGCLSWWYNGWLKKPNRPAKNNGTHKPGSLLLWRNKDRLWEGLPPLFSSDLSMTMNSTRSGGLFWQSLSALTEGGFTYAR